MPEPFLWDIFHHLVEAAVAMRYGPASGRWGGQEIVHWDIKPGNSSTPELFPNDCSGQLESVFLDVEDRKSGNSFLPKDQVGRLGSRSAEPC